MAADALVKLLDGALSTTKAPTLDGITIGGHQANATGLDLLEADTASAARSVLGLANGATTTISAFALTLLDDADAATARSTLGLGLTDSPSFAGLKATGGTFAVEARTTTSGQASIGIFRDGAATDEKRVEILHDDIGDFVIRNINDAYTSASEIFRGHRGTGTAVEKVTTPVDFESSSKIKANGFYTTKVNVANGATEEVDINHSQGFVVIISNANETRCAVLGGSDGALADLGSGSRAAVSGATPAANDVHFGVATLSGQPTKLGIYAGSLAGGTYTVTVFAS